jgi:hypothetical protein
MSLKAFHIIFVGASSLLALVLGVWSFWVYASPEGGVWNLIAGVLSLLGFAGLLIYGKYFLNKLKHISYL